MFSITALKNTLNQSTKAHAFIIAYSGGLDSHVLLHAMHALKKNNPALSLIAVHVNHQINPHADAWAAHCAAVCDALQIPIRIETISIDLQPGDSLEENARDARYAALKKHLNKDTVLLTAHHANDQAETFLLQALRGAGPKGLSAMPIKKTVGDGFLIRPLLSFSRDALEKYALENKLHWIEDDSNHDPRFRRNYLRHTIMPLLEKEWPSVAKNFSRSAHFVAAHEHVVDEIIKKDFEMIQTDDVKKINLQALRAFSVEKQALLLREWFSGNQLRMPNQKHIQQILKDVVNAAPDAHPVFRLEELRLWRDRQWLYLACASQT